MDIRHLKNFVAIVDRGSLSKAADQVYVAQPALNRQIAGLESELGAQLLLRSRRGVVPTEAGKVLYRHARTVLRQIERIHVEVALPGAGEIGPVPVGLPATMISVIGVPLFERVGARPPGIRLNLLEPMSGYLGDCWASDGSTWRSSSSLPKRAASTCSHCSKRISTSWATQDDRSRGIRASLPSWMRSRSIGGAQTGRVDVVLHGDRDAMQEAQRTPIGSGPVGCRRGKARAGFVDRRHRFQPVVPSPDGVDAEIETIGRARRHGG